jgi:hypothetical protein
MSATELDLNAGRAGVDPADRGDGGVSSPRAARGRVGSERSLPSPTRLVPTLVGTCRVGEM